MSEITGAAKHGGRSMTVFGIIAIVMGVIAMITPGITGMSVALVVGILVVGAGIARMIWAFKVGSLGGGLLMFAIGGLTLLCGIMLVANPLFASGTLTILLAVYFVADGVSEMAAGFQQRPAPGSNWMLFGGIVSIVLGIMMWRQFPLAGAWAIGVLVGIKLVSVGLIMVTGGSVVRSAVKD